MRLTDKRKKILGSIMYSIGIGLVWIFTMKYRLSIQVGIVLIVPVAAHLLMLENRFKTKLGMLYPDPDENYLCLVGYYVLVISIGLSLFLK